MSAWEDALMDSRVEEARAAYSKLAEVEWEQLSHKDRALSEALGYICLERDDIDLLGLCDHDFGENE